ncbi:MAG: LysR family transcriptional regulator [Solirubrobacterales bacterium]|nr:LysR family transcriptional regulator [Solirubrobacterales bacterium]
MPELRHLRYFVAVAEELSFARAADRLHMAASPLSQAIRQLEDELGTPLFLRTTRKVELTDAGRRLLDQGAVALEAVDAAFAAAARAGRGVEGTIRVGFTTAARHELRPRLVALLRERHPGLQVDVSEATSGALCRELLSRRLDLALTFAAGPTPGVARRKLTDERLVVLLRRSHRLAARDAVHFDDLRGDRFVVPAEELNTGFNGRLRAWCAEHGFEPATVVASVIWDDEEWPPGDDVVAVATERWARHVPDRLRALPLVPEQHLPIELAWREDDASPVLATVREVASGLT